jgi:hypothetical protein
MSKSAVAAINRRDVRDDRDILQDIAKACETTEVLGPAALLIDGLRKLIPYGPLLGNRRRNKKYLSDVWKQLAAFEKALKAVPTDFPVYLLLAQKDAATLDDMMKDAEARWEYLAGELGYLRLRCDELIRANMGEHRSAGYQQERAAVAAAELMDLCGKPLAWSSPTSAYRRVAGLFFEAMTREQGHDLERACEAMARDRIQTEKSK